MYIVLCMNETKFRGSQNGEILSMARAAADLVVCGRVQGVGFRFFVREHARDFRITGWVKNLPDRNVEIHAEGEKPDIEEFIGRVKKGPSFSHVTDVDIDWLEPSDQYSSFDIRF